MAFQFFKRLTSPETTIGDTFFENSDGCARGRRNILFGNLFANMVVSLSSGIYFTSLMLAMGASDAYIGYVTAIVSFSGLFQLVSPLILEKIPKRKSIIMSARILYHFLNIVAVGIIPILPIAHFLKLVLFFITVITLNAINHIATPGLSAWHLQSLPMSKRAGYCTVCNVTISIINNITTFLAGLLFDKIEASEISFGNLSPTITAILVIRFIALLLAVVECYNFSMIKEFPYETEKDGNKSRGIKLLLVPLRDKMFVGTIILPILWAFIAGIVGQYFNIYLIEDIRMSYSLITLGGFISTPIILIVTPIWYRAIRRISWPKVLAVGQLGNVIAYTLNAFITKETEFIYFLCIICGSIFSTGVTLVHTNLLYLHMPEANRTAYFSSYSVMTLLAAFLGNYTGIFFISVTNGMSFSFLGFDIANKQYISWVSAVLFLALAVLTLSYLRKKEHRITVVK